MKILIGCLFILIFSFQTFGFSFDLPSINDINPFSSNKKEKELNYKPLSNDVKEYIKHIFIQNQLIQEVAMKKAEILNSIAYHKFKDTEEDKNIAIHTAYSFAKIDTCFDAIVFKYLGYSKNSISLIEIFNKNMKMLVLDSQEKIKNYAKFNHLLNSFIIDIPVATGENYEEIIDDYCPEQIKGKLK